MEGTLEVGDRTVSVADITAPVLVFGGADDTIAPVGAVRSVVPLLTGSPEVRFEIVPGGHLGMLTGRRARAGTWPVLDAWVDEWTTSPAAPRRPPRKKAAQPAARRPAKRTAKKATPSAVPSIGSNPDRRYGSASSRALRR